MPHRFTRIVAVMLFAVMLVTGCAVRVGDPPLIERLMPLLRFATMMGTDRILTQNPTVTPVVIQVSTGLMTLFSTNETATMAQIHATIRAYLNTMTLDSDVRMVIEALLQSVVMELRAVIIHAGVADDKVTLYLHAVVGWVREAAMRHVVVLPPQSRGK